jgi:hypothetical protein
MIDNAVVRVDQHGDKPEFMVVGETQGATDETYKSFGAALAVARGKGIPCKHKLVARKPRGKKADKAKADKA